MNKLHVLVLFLLACSGSRGSWRAAPFAAFTRSVEGTGVGEEREYLVTTAEVAPIVEVIVTGAERCTVVPGRGWSADRGVLTGPPALVVRWRVRCGPDAGVNPMVQVRDADGRSVSLGPLH